MEFDVSNLISVFVGGLLVFAAQWFVTRQSAKVEEQKWKYFDQMQKDISSSRVIHDSDIRGAVSQILWQSTDQEAIVRKDSQILQDVYLRLENWIFNPNLITTRFSVEIK